jgi:hypothetical protein
VHGLDFKADNSGDFFENPTGAAAQFQLVTRSAAGIEYQVPIAGTHSFFLVVPTPVILLDFFQQVRGITFYYDTHDSAIATVSVFDGSNLVANFTPNWSGNHSGTYDPQFNQLTLTKAAAVSRGLVIQVDVNFNPSFSNPQLPFANVRFAALGVEFASGQTWFTNLLQWLASRSQP